jgi:hypothetical protein
VDQIKGAFIRMVGAVMSPYREESAKADAWLKSKLGRSYKDLEPDEWYDFEIFIDFLKKYSEASPVGDKAFAIIGGQVFQTAKYAQMLPPDLATPVDFLEFEFHLYLQSLKGPNIHPRKLLQATDGDVRIEVLNPPPREFDLLMEGVFLGAVAMAGVRDATVEQTRCVQRGDAVCEYRITW